MPLQRKTAILRILGSGTSTGVPVPGCQCKVCKSPNSNNKRLRTSAAVITDRGRVILIDATTDLRQQVLRWGIERIDAVLFTHPHADHILGIDDLRGFNYSQQSAIPCYGEKHTFAEIRHIFRYVFERDPSYVGGNPPSLTLHEIQPTTPFEVEGLRIQPFPLKHGNMMVTGFRIGDFAYATDVKEIPPVSREILEGVKVIVLDGLRYEPHAAHLTIPEAAALVQEMNIPEAYLTHMTHSVDHDTTNATLPNGIRLAYDGLEFSFQVESACLH